MIDLTSASPAIFVNVHRASVNAGNKRRWQADFVFHRLTVIGQLKFRVIYAIELPKHSDKISLSAKDIDSNRYVERASKLQRLEIFGERHPFAIAFQSFFIDRFKAEEHGSQAEPLPELEDFLVS